VRLDQPDLVFGEPFVDVEEASTRGAASLRWMVLHMLEETARHAGHLDAIRELLDGTKGHY